MNPEDLTPEEREYVGAEEAVIRSETRMRLLWRELGEVEQEVRDIQNNRREWLRSLASASAGFPLTEPLPVAPPVSADLTQKLDALGLAYGTACAVHARALEVVKVAKSNLRRS
jgi:hypothetical protein